MLLECGFAGIARVESFERRSGPKVQEKSNLHICCSQIVEKLLRVGISRGGRCFQLRNDLPLDYEISAKLPNTDLVVPYINREFALYGEVLLS